MILPCEEICKRAFEAPAEEQAVSRGTLVFGWWDTAAERWTSACRTSGGRRMRRRRTTRPRTDPCGEARAPRAPPARLATGQIPNPRHGAACTEAAITHPCGPPGYTPLRLAPRKPPPTENAP